MPKAMNDVLLHDVMHKLFGTVEKRIHDELWHHIATTICETSTRHVRWNVKDSITGESE